MIRPLNLREVVLLLTCIVLSAFLFISEINNNLKQEVANDREMYVKELRSIISNIKEITVKDSIPVPMNSMAPIQELR